MTRADAAPVSLPGAGSGGGKGERKGERPASGLRLAAVGMEAELGLVLDGEEVSPEDAFGDPRSFMRGALLHRTGTSYHLPTGGIVYFDTGVIEVATPAMELERGAPARAGRNLWESLRLVRGELDAWEGRTGRHARLVGFSTHHNVSFELPAETRGRRRTVEKLAWLLVHVLPVPVMLLGANRRSTGIGVRPRGERIEVTLDFTPSPALMIATATFVTGVVREAMSWPSFETGELDARGVPVVEGFTPLPHSSRQGWVARAEGFPGDPFRTDVDAHPWPLRGGGSLSLRGIGRRIFRIFRRSVGRFSDPFTFRLVRAVMGGHAPILLDLPDRPPEYEDVGRLCFWDDLFPTDVLSRSRYERVLVRAISGQRLRLGGRLLVPTGIRGWSEVVFREPGGGRYHRVAVDDLVEHLDDWEAPRTPRRAPRPAPGAAEGKG